jgi:predicted phosphodiesterase
MKILTLSDRVEPVLYDQFDRRQFEDVDLILACGDLPPEYLSFISGKLNVPLYFVRGNHDLRYDAGPPQGCVNLVDELVQFSGKNILGLEGSRWYNGGPHQYTEREMQRKIRRLRPRIWHRHGTFTMQKTVVTEALRVFAGCLTNIHRTISFMATFTQILPSRPNGLPSLTAQTLLIPMDIMCLILMIPGMQNRSGFKTPSPRFMKRDFASI